MSGLSWVLLSPLFVLMALISKDESLTSYYVHVAAFGVWAACGVVAGIARIASVPWAGRLQAILFWIACAYFCVPMTFVLILWLFHPEAWNLESFLALGVLLTGFTLLYIVRRRNMREDRGLP
ncbi:MAG TPA: hypothetical protein VJT11_07870 [Nitrospiraceae bacterium]|nr:hypothetical protein [Nitrospiraceae bacterium]